MDDAIVYGNVVVRGKACVCKKAIVHGDSVLIEDNAIVTDDVEISGGAKIADNVLIEDNVKVKGIGVEIRGYARVYGDVIIAGNAKIFGKSKIGCEAIIAGNAHIRGGHITGKPFLGDSCFIEDGRNDYVVFENFGSRLDILTAYKTKYGGVKISTGCFLGSIDEFKKAVEKTHGDNEKIKKEYFYIIDIIKNRFDL
jgi:carbonic anhydrase/acetyltransferase-like protein (isoleucine patch superfamily)